MLTDDEEQLALKLCGVGHVGAGRIVRPHDSHPLLVPPDLVHPIVMTARRAERHLVELRVEEQGAKRILSAGRSAVNADAARVVPGMRSGKRPMPQDAIRESG